MLDIALWSGRSNRSLAERIAGTLARPLSPMRLQSFADGEIQIKVPKSFKAKSIYIIQSLSTPIHHHLMELLLLIDAAHQTGCTHIGVVLPYLAYARQDKLESDYYTPLAAKRVADLLASPKLQRIISMDLHSPVVERFFSTPLEVLSSTTLFAEAIYQDCARDISNKTMPLIVSPDLGGCTRAQDLASALKTDYLVLDKKADTLRIVDAIVHAKDARSTYAQLHDRDCILVDDIVDSGRTLCNAAAFLKTQGAAQVLAYATHAVLSKDALPFLLGSDLDRLTLTDSISLSGQSQVYLDTNPEAARKLKILSVANCFANSLRV